MTSDRDRLIRERAYEIWESEGRPHGREEEHWRQAAAEIAAAEQPAPAGASASAGAPVPPEPPAAKAPPQRRSRAVPPRRTEGNGTTARRKPEAP